MQLPQEEEACAETEGYTTQGFKGVAKHFLLLIKPSEVFLSGDIQRDNRVDIVSAEDRCQL